MGKILVTKPSMPEYEEYIAEIKSIWDTRHITNFGPKYNALKDAIKSRFGYENVDLQCNGHMTLQNILATVEPGEIITTPFTFISTTLAIENTGHKAVFCDINPIDFTIDVDKIEGLINEKTVAIVPVHVFGMPCDVERIEIIANKYNLKVIYDAAHAFGVKYKGKAIGNYGDASMFSFHATKAYNSIEGGMGVFRDADLCEEVRCRSNFGLGGDEFIPYGVNSKMNEFQAAMGLVNLRHLDDCISARKACAEFYDQHLSEIDSIQVLKRANCDTVYNYAYYPILFKDETCVEQVIKQLEKHDIFTRRYFYPLTSDLLRSNEVCKTTIAKKISDNILCLPIYSDLSRTQQIKVIEEIKKVI